MTVRFEFEWDDPGLVSGQELRATWARLQISIGNEVVTRIVDKAVQAERFAIYVPLYPLAEWIAQNWFFITAEIRTPESARDPHEFGARHSLRFSGDGYVWPDLTFLALEEKMELEWKRYRPEFSRIEFLGTGTAIVEREAVLPELRRVVEACLYRLTEYGISRSDLQAEWDAISSLTEDEVEFANASAAFGLDPFSISARQANALLAASELGDQKLVSDVLTASRGLDLTHQVAWLRQRVAAVRRLEGALADLPEMRSVAKGIPNYLPPHEQGFWLANKLRAALDINGHPIRGTAKPKVADVARLFGADDWRGAISLRVEQGQPIQALSLGGSKPRFGINKPRPDSQRFLLARAIYKHLTEAHDDIGIVATSDSIADRAGRSFAAEFLAPAQGLRKRVPSTVIDASGVAELAAEFGVSELVIKYQLENHQLAVLG